MANKRTKEELIEILIPAIIKNSGEPIEVVRARLRATDAMELHYMEMKQRRAGLLPPDTEIKESAAIRGWFDPLVLLEMFFGVENTCAWATSADVAAHERSARTVCPRE